MKSVITEYFGSFVPVHPPRGMPKALKIHVCPKCKKLIQHSDWPRLAGGRLGTRCAECPSLSGPKPREHRLAVKRANGARLRERQRAAGIVKRRPTEAEREQLKLETKAAHRLKIAQRDGWRQGPPCPDRIRHKVRLRNDPQFVVNMRMRTAIGKALKGGKAGRKWESLVGFGLADLVERLRETMPVGYSMADFGRGHLHIDHVIPRRLFDVSTPDGLRECWSLLNLQTLTATDNMRKGGRVDHLTDGQSAGQSWR